MVRRTCKDDPDTNPANKRCPDRGAGDGSSAVLADTGSPTVGITATGGAAIVLGTLLVLLARRRRAAAARSHGHDGVTHP